MRAKPTFIPHLPPQFDGTLILGESMYHGPDTNTKTGWPSWFDEGFPEQYIIKHVEEQKELDENVFRCLRESFEPVLTPPEFWNRKAFTNFVPELLPDSKRPTKAQWEAGEREFDLVLDYVNPRRILVVGGADANDGLWVRLPTGEREEGNSCFFRSDILAMCIPHPRRWNIRGYTITDARSVTSKLMKYA